MKQLLHNESSIWRHRDLRIAAGARAVSFLGDEIALIALLLRIHDTGAGTARGRGPAAGRGASPPSCSHPGPVGSRTRYDSRRGARDLRAGPGGAVRGPRVRGADPRAMLALVAAPAGRPGRRGPAWAALVPEIVGEGETGRAVGACSRSPCLPVSPGRRSPGLLVAVSGTTGRCCSTPRRSLVLAAAGCRVRTRRGGAATPRTQAPSRGCSTGADHPQRDALLAPADCWACWPSWSCGEVTNVVEVFLVRDPSGPDRRPSGSSVRCSPSGPPPGPCSAGGRSDDRAGRPWLVVLTAAGRWPSHGGRRAGCRPSSAFGLVWWLLTGHRRRAPSTCRSRPWWCVRSPERSAAARWSPRSSGLDPRQRLGRHPHRRAARPRARVRGTIYVARWRRCGHRGPRHDRCCAPRRSGYQRCRARRPSATSSNRWRSRAEPSRRTADSETASTKSSRTALGRRCGSQAPLPIGSQRGSP